MGVGFFFFFLQPAKESLIRSREGSISIMETEQISERKGQLQALALAVSHLPSRKCYSDLFLIIFPGLGL